MIERERPTRGVFIVVEGIDGCGSTTHAKRLAKALPRFTRPGGMVYVESSRGVDWDAPWRLHRQGRAGHVTYQLYRHGDQ